MVADELTREELAERLNRAHFTTQRQIGEERYCLRDILNILEGKNL